ncbi:MAG TPA: LysM peptidoglycan-binding domain-containing protein [Rhizomicrobium sp.]|nr:LysM peptidoglycan-binding domain-containing protein [Rhizomicrobium sp.]
MVAIVTGNGLGLDRSSSKVFAQVGQSGGIFGDASFGRFGENVYVNAFNGNLMVQRTDEVLVGQGPDDVISYAYNSLGLNQGYMSQHGWQISDSRAVVGLTGTVNTAGSTVTRIDADGSDTLYAWDSAQSAYICKDGGNAGYELTYDTTHSKWTWTDSANDYSETYDAAHGGRLSGASDTSNNGLSYTYDPTSGLLTSVTTDNGEHTYFTWSATGTNLLQVTVKDATDTFIESRVSYTYGTTGRLKTVTTDLSPTDGVVGSDAVTTTYFYDGSSDRISRITQTGGAEVDFTYDTSNRITGISQRSATGVWRATGLAYFSGRTEVTDQNGKVTKLYYDSIGQLTSVTYPPAVAGGASESYTYTYNTRGDLLTATDALNNTTTYNYNSDDDLQWTTDTLGNRIDYTYDSLKHLTIKTYTPGSGQPGQIATFRYTYDSAGRQTFAIDDAGEVTQYIYNGTGQMTAQLAFPDAVYDLTGVSRTTALTDSQLSTWVANLKAASAMATVSRTNYTYDFRGNLATETRFTICKATNGNGLTTSPYTVMTYTYDQAGNLLTRQTSGISATEVFTYDGLNRMVSSTDLHGTSTTMIWDDVNDTCTVTVGGDLTTVSTYNQAGELITVSKSGTGLTSPDLTKYQYDDMGRLRIVNDATGVQSYFLYDDLGRKVADIADDGSIVEYRYDMGNRLVATIAHINKLSSTQLNSLVDTSGNPNDAIHLSDVLPSGSNSDSWTWRIYDGDARLVQTIDNDGDVVNFTYDDNSNLIQTTGFYAKLSALTVSSYKNSIPTSPVTVTTTSGQDDTTRNFYDAENRLIGTLDGDGYLSQIKYDHAGRKIETIAYAQQVPSAHRGDAQFSNVLGSISTSLTTDSHTRYFYDDRDLLLFTLDSNLYATQYVYDAAGDLTHTVGYAAPIASTATYTLSYVQAQVATLGSQPNHHGWSVYDPATGDLDYSIDAGGTVTAYTRDALGRVTQTTQYNALDLNVTTLPTVGDMVTWVTNNASATLDRTTRNVYDAENRLRYTIDPENFVTRMDYDDADRITLKVRYATAYSSSGVPNFGNMVSWQGVSIPTTAIATGYSYDSDGRLSHTIDDLGGLNINTYTQYDGIGRVTDVTQAWGSPDTVTTHYTYDTAGRVLTKVEGVGTSAQATTSYTSYDGQGHVLAVTNPDGKSTTYTYDALGQLLTVTDPNLITTSNSYDAFGNVASFTDGRNKTSYYYYDLLNRLSRKVDAMSNETKYQYDAFGNVIKITDPLNGLIYSFYDKLNRLICQIDQLRYVTRTTYTSRGDVATVTRLVNPVRSNVTIVAGVMPQETDFDPSSDDQVTSFARDRLGRITQSTDAMGFYEKYTLDAFGNRTKVWAKSNTGTVAQGGLTTNTYDHRGLLLSEDLPVTAYDSNGNPETGDVINSYTYDLRGNRKTMVEADGLAEERTTTYNYDALNRLTSTVGDSVDIVDDDDFNNGHSLQPTTVYIYDAMGKLIETDDPTGARTLFYYDDGGRKIAEVSPTGTLTTWDYDGNGNVTSTRVYGDELDLDDLDPHDPAPDPVDPDKFRETVYQYDDLNRLTFTIVHDLRTGVYSGGSYTFTTGDVSTQNIYNKTTNALHQIDGNGGNLWTYYDALGRKVAEVDQTGYLTTYVLDTNGNVKTETRFANPVTGLTIADGTTLATVVAHVTADSTNDRVTQFTYDRNGQRLTESRLNVAAWDIDTTSGAKSAHSTTTSTITYTYNGLGEVLTKTQATGDSVTYFYDQGGRQTEVLNSVYTNVADDTGAHTAVQEQMNEKYDGLGNLVFTNSLDALESPHNYHVTNYIYGKGGRLDAIVDADNFRIDYVYDAAGRVVIASYDRLHSDNVTTTSEAQITQYDAAGRVLVQGTATRVDANHDWVLESTQGVDYNAYGEVAHRLINDVVQQVYYYDDAGRVVKTSDEGVITFTFYDKAGNQTLALTSDGGLLGDGSTLRSLSPDDVVSLVTGGTNTTLGAPVQGIDETITVNDARGEATETHELHRQLAGNATDGYTYADLLEKRTYNAFGEVMSEVDARNYTTTFTYSTLGKVLSQVSPTVRVWNEQGTYTDTTPIQYDFYDISGRLVGVEDPNAVLATTHYYSTRLLVGGTGYDGSDALVAEEFHADGGKLRNIYDAANNVVENINEVGAFTKNVYDDMNRLTQVTHPTAANGQNLIDHYTYDNFGRRLAHWSSVISSAHKELTDYDAEGRLATSIDADGYTTSYDYDWLDNTASHGLVETGGWKKTTTNPAGLQDVLIQDAEGRTISETDFGGNSITYSYDYAGQVHTRINDYIPAWANDGQQGFLSPHGETLTYSYFNTGRLAGESSQYSWVVFVHDWENGIDYGMDETITDTLISSYSYDENGNLKTEDQIHKGGNRWDPDDAINEWVEHESATYDALNRMLTMNDTAPTSLPDGMTNGVDDPIHITMGYDADGNVRFRTSTYYLLKDNGDVDTYSGLQTENYWYTYDRMNRFLITKGALQGTTIGIGSYGTQLTYDAAGERITAVTEEFGTSTTETDTYHYAADGTLYQTDIVASGTTMYATYAMDTMGRVTTYKETNSTGSVIYYERDVTNYDYDSLATHDVVTTLRSDNKTDVRTTDYTYTDSSSHFLGGVVVKTTTSDALTGQSTQHTSSTYQYDWFSSAVEAGEDYDSDTNNANNTIYHSELNYDMREQLIHADIQDGTPRVIHYESNLDGQITSRSTTGVGNAPYARYYYFGGVQMGDVSNDGTSNVDYVTAIASHRAVPGGGYFNNGANSGVHVADFDQSYDTINGLTYQSTQSSYTVRTGDTLQSIAQAMWGDASFWYLIAQANGLDSTSTLVAGQTLAIPNKIANVHNSSDTYNVYDPNEAIGNISPTHPPKPQPHHGCGILGQILMIVVSVVVAALIPGVGAAIGGAITTALGGGTLATLAGTFIGAAVVGAISDAAGQLAGLAVGAIKSFNWGEVGMAAISAGIGGPSPGMDLPTAVISGVVGNMLTQGIEVATGLKKSFNWLDVATAGLSAGVIQQVDSNLGTVDASGQYHANDLGFGRFNGVAEHAISGMAGAIATASMQSLVKGTDFGDNLMKALPGVIGQTIGGAIAVGLQQSRTSSVTSADKIMLPQQQIDYQIPSIGDDGTVSLASHAETQETATLILNAKGAGYSDTQIADAVNQGLTYVPANSHEGMWTNQSGTEVYIGDPAAAQSNGGGTTYIQNGYGDNIASGSAPPEYISKGVPDTADDIFGSDTRLFPSGTSNAPVLLKFPDGSLYYNVGGQLYSYAWAAQSYLQATSNQPQSYTEAGMFYEPKFGSDNPDGALGLIAHGLGYYADKKAEAITERLAEGKVMYKGEERWINDVKGVKGRVAVSTELLNARLLRIGGYVGGAVAAYSYGKDLVDNGFSTRASIKDGIGLALTAGAVIPGVDVVAAPAAIVYGVLEYTGAVDWALDELNIKQPPPG